MLCAVYSGLLTGSLNKSHTHLKHVISLVVFLLRLYRDMCNCPVLSECQTFHLQVLTTYKEVNYVCVIRNSKRVISLVSMKLIKNQCRKLV
jgi:hypothetical protein